MKQLIVNADDFNTDAERNRGIGEAARLGIVTSTSVLTNVGWPAGSREQLRELSQDNLGIGVHLNLTKGRPLLPDAHSLTGPDGIFFTKARAWQHALRRGFDPGEAEREFSAQIEALCKAGFAPDHIDGNNHLHVFPGLAAAAARAARRFGISCVRLPREPFRWSAGRLPGLKKCLLYALSLHAGGIFRHAGLTYPQHCAGLQAPAAGDGGALERFLCSLSDGTTELMCHPGYPAADNPFSTGERHRELEALTGAGVRDIIKARNIHLIHFGHLS